MIPTGVNLLKNGKWAKGEFANCRGLKGRTLGLVGFGNISALVAKIAIAMGLTVIANDPHQRHELESLLGITYVETVDELLARSDIVSLHVPSTPKTKGLVNAAFLGKMKKDGVLINTSRGDVVKDSDLLAHLNANKGFWYGADVLHGEPSESKADYDNPIAKHPQAYITHHCGASTKQAEAEIGVEATRVLKKFKATGVVDNQVNKTGFVAGPAPNKTAEINGTGLKSEALFQKMVPLLATNGAEFVKKVGAVFHFEIKKDKDSQPVIFTVDLKNGNGAFANGKVGTADATFTILDQDILDMAAGKLNPQNAFIQGKMKIKGNMAKAMKFTPDLLPKDAKL